MLVVLSGSLQVSDLFQEKAQDWDSRDMVRQISQGVGQSILNSIVLDSDMRVMDFGAGTGLVSSHVAPHVSSITAVDISAAMLEKLSAKPELEGKVEIRCQDIIAQPLTEKFNLIISAMAMHHVEDTDSLIAALAEHLQSGGRIALADLDEEDGTFHPADVQGVFHHGFSRDALLEIFTRHGFSDVQFRTAHVAIKEGREYPIFLVTAQRSQ